MPSLNDVQTRSGCGAVIVGAVMSTTVTFWLQEALLPQASVASQTPGSHQESRRNDRPCCYRANNCDGVSAALSSAVGNTSKSGGAKFDRFVRVAASNHRGGGVDDSHFLAALSAVAARSVACQTRVDIKGRAAMTGPCWLPC